MGLTIVSENILFDSIASLGLMIAFYYGMTGFTCAWFFRREVFASGGAFVRAGLLPFLGGVMLLGLFVKSCFYLAKPETRPPGIRGSAWGRRWSSASARCCWAWS